MSLRIVPIYRDQANAFVTAWHRHHRPTPGQLFAIGAAMGDILVGVAVVGRPVARHLDDGLTVEVTRVATTGAHNACSLLYGASWRAAKARGFVRALTYTRDDEAGASLRAAGWIHAIRRDARPGWDTPGRRRDNSTYDPVVRHRWCVGAWHWDGGVLAAEVGPGLPSAMSMPEGAAAPEPMDLFGSLFDEVA